MYPLARRGSALQCVSSSSSSSSSSRATVAVSSTAASAVTSTSTSIGTGKIGTHRNTRALSTTTKATRPSAPATRLRATACCPRGLHHHHHRNAGQLVRTPVRLQRTATHPARPPILVHILHFQRRVLQTSSGSSPLSSPSSSPASTSHCSAPTGPPPAYTPPVEPRALFPRLLLGRNRRLRYTHLPAIVMGAAHQTRDSADHHRLRGSHSHDEHDHGHDDHGHSHSHFPGLGGHHHHHHDNTYLVSRNRNDPGVRITNIGLMANLAMAATKFIGGFAFNSKAMVADGWHSMTDLASDVLTLATVSWSLKPPTERFPLGFGKVESLGALGVSGMLLVGGCYMGWDSAITLYEHFNPEAARALLEYVGEGHGHSHGVAALGVPSIHAAWIAGGTVLVKEWLYHATMKVARERRSSVLASNAVHHRVDSLTGIVTLAAIVGANVIEHAGWLDPVGGLLISIMVVHAGAGNMVDAFCELADQSIDHDVKNAVSRRAKEALSELPGGHDTELRDVSGIKSGQNFLMDLEVSAPGTWSVDRAREVESAIRQRVGEKVRGVRRVRVRFVSQQEPSRDKFDEFIMDSPRSSMDEDPESKHDENDKKTK